VAQRKDHSRDTDVRVLNSYLTFACVGVNTEPGCLRRNIDEALQGWDGSG